MPILTVVVAIDAETSMNGWAKATNSRDVRSELFGGNRTRSVSGGGSSGDALGGKGEVAQSRRGRAFAAVTRVQMMIREEPEKN